MNQHVAWTSGFADDRVSYYPQETVYPALANREPSAFPTMLGAVMALYLLCTVVFSQRETLSYLSQAIAILATVLWLVWSLSTGMGFKLPRPMAWYALWFIWATAGMPICESGQPFNQVYMTIAKVALISLVASQCVRTRGDILACFLVLSLASILVFALGARDVLKAVNYQKNQAIINSRATTTLLANSNMLAFFAVATLVMSVACFLAYRSKLLKIATAITIPFGFYLLAASGSRKGMGSIVLVAVGLYWFHFRKAWHGVTGKLAAFAVGGILIVGAIVFLSRLPTLNRLTRTVGESGAYSKEARFVWFIRGLEITANHPVFGLGVGGFALMGESGHFGTYTHSTITETLTGTGIPGFILYFGSQASLFILINRTRKAEIPARDKAILNCCMCLYGVWMLYHVFSVMLNGRLAWPLMAAITGYCLQLRRDYSLDRPNYY